MIDGTEEFHRANLGQNRPLEAPDVREGDTSGEAGSAAPADSRRRPLLGYLCILPGFKTVDRGPATPSDGEALHVQTPRNGTGENRGAESASRKPLSRHLLRPAFVKTGRS